MLLLALQLRIQDFPLGGGGASTCWEGHRPPDAGTFWWKHVKTEELGPAGEGGGHRRRPCIRHCVKMGADPLQYFQASTPANAQLKRALLLLSVHSTIVIGRTQIQ